MYDYITIDTETTIFQKGNPYSQRNKLCLVGIRTNTNETEIFDIEYSDNAYETTLQKIQDYIKKTKILVLFNAKFDLAWLRRYNINYSHCRIFDCQLCAFILSGQRHSYPSLNGVAEAYSLGQKLDVVKEQYWDKGIDTNLVPYNVLSEYLSKDLEITHKVYLAQLKELATVSQATRTLVSLSNQDLLVLLEMEWNGLKFDFTGMQHASTIVTTQIESIHNDLRLFFNDCPSSILNFNSGDCLSCLLYGGNITEIQRTQSGLYKTGPKTGQPRYSLTPVQHMLPRRVDPPRGSELKKEGFFATNEKTLRSLKAQGALKSQIENILSLGKLDKLNGTYYIGLQKLHTEKDFEPHIIHGQFNQCMARTGRISSSGPNLQNFPQEIDQYTITRYA